MLLIESFQASRDSLNHPFHSPIWLGMIGQWFDLPTANALQPLIQILISKFSRIVQD